MGAAPQKLGGGDYDLSRLGDIENPGRDCPPNYFAMILIFLELGLHAKFQNFFCDGHTLKEYILLDSLYLQNSANFEKEVKSSIWIAI